MYGRKRVRIEKLRSKDFLRATLGRHRTTEQGKRRHENSASVLNAKTVLSNWDCLIQLGLSYPLTSIGSRIRIVLSFKDSPRKPFGQRPASVHPPMQRLTNCPGPRRTGPDCSSNKAAANGRTSERRYKKLHAVRPDRRRRGLSSAPCGRSTNAA